MAMRYLARCAACGKVEHWGLVEVLESLRQLGMFRREAQPSADILEEVLRKTAPRLPCSDCQARGLEVRRDESRAGSDAHRCSGCGAPIPWERLELFPTAELCAACQQVSERSGGAATEYCPKCGNVMILRPVHGRGVTHYRLACPHCRR